MKRSSRSVLILLLIISGCTEKKAQAVEKPIPEPVKVAPMKIYNNANLNPIFAKLSISNVNLSLPIEVSYDKGLDLMLVDTDFRWIISRILANRDEGLAYSAIYWDKNNNRYYTIYNDIALLYPIAVSNINFVYTIDETKQYEPVFDSSLKEIFPDTQASLLYLGSISPLERLYLDPTNQVYYIKKLTFFDTSFYISYDNADNEQTNLISSPVYPIIISNISTSYDYDRQVTNSILVLNTYFTNTNHQIFWIPTRDNNEIAFALSYRNK
ncbi:MAG: hypothetical protein ACRC0X_02970 [Brevinema sp.]